MAVEIDMRKLLTNLEHLEPEKKEQSFEEMMRQVSIASALPTLTEINHEKEYLACRQVVQHLTGKIYLPDEFESE